jgi:hypothetical protein
MTGPGIGTLIYYMLQFSDQGISWRVDYSSTICLAVRVCLLYYFIYSWLFIVFNCRILEAPMFTNLQDLKEQDFEQLGGGKCP